MSADFSELRVKMVDGQVRTTDVTSAPLLEALLSVPREVFVGDRQRDLAYIDGDIRIADGAGGARYLMEASPLAKLMQLAEINPTDSVLDVGSGSGYASAVLSRLARSVVALESDSALAQTAASTLSGLGCGNVTVVQGRWRKVMRPRRPTTSSSSAAVSRTCRRRCSINSPKAADSSRSKGRAIPAWRDFFKAGGCNRETGI